MEKTRAQLKAELRELYALLHDARIECSAPKGRFRQDTCGKCAGCQLLHKLDELDQPYKQQR